MIHDLFAGAGEAAKTSRRTAGREPEMYDGDRDLCSFETTAVNSVRSIDRDCLTSLHQPFPAECAYPAAEQARQDAEEAGLELHLHSKTHRC
jgi:hypothetical protein